MKRVPCRRRAPGFTLVELLVVIAILGVLVALISSAVAASQNSARVAASMSNLRQIGAAALAYVGENNGQMVPHAVFDAALGNNREWCFAYGAGSGGNALREGLLGPYLANAESVLRCPAQVIDKDLQAQTENGFGRRPAIVGYGYNGFLLSRRLDRRTGTWQGYAMASIAQPSRTVMFATSGTPSGSRVAPYENIWPKSYSRTPVLRAVDGDHALVCFVDGHVARVKLSDLNGTDPKLGHATGEGLGGDASENIFDLE